MTLEEEFELAVATQTDRLWRLAFAITDDVAEAEDVVQETMERAWRRWRTVRLASQPEAWLTRVCINRAIDIRRRLGTRLRLVDALRHRPAPTVPDAGEALDISRLYRSLTRHQRAVLVLHYRHGYTLDECAAIMGSRPGTVRSHLARGLATLREAMGDE